MMGKDSVCWGWDERGWRRKEKSYARHCGRWNQRFSLSGTLFNDESPLVFWKLFSYFKICPNFHKESLRHTQHCTVKKNYHCWEELIQPLQADEDNAYHFHTHLLEPMGPKEVKSFQGQSVYPQLKAMVWHFAALEPSALHVEKFSKGNFGCIQSLCLWSPV